jgi:hypothetical protein
MELVKNVFFNTDKLIENTKIKISYTGKFFEENAEQVFLHYGFGENWDNVNEIEMTKTELGFQAELELPESDRLNFCLRDSNNNWDNNNGEDYSFSIEKPQVSLIALESSQLDTPRRLRKSYIWSKKIKLAVYKIVHYLPKLISGNYKRKVSEN